MTPSGAAELAESPDCSMHGSSAAAGDTTEVLLYTALQPLSPAAAARADGRSTAQASRHTASTPLFIRTQPHAENPPPCAAISDTPALDGCIRSLPLAVLEYIAAEVNRFLEHTRGEGSVQVRVEGAWPWLAPAAVLCV